jgi:hypothetical protein
MREPGHRTDRRANGTQRKALAATSLVLGLVSVPALAACGLGLPLALAGIVTGVIALAKAGSGAGAATVKRMAIAGLVVSLITVLGGIWLLSKAAECGDESRYRDEEAQRRCVEREFPFAFALPRG